MQFYSFDREWINKTLSGGALNNLATIKALNRQGYKKWVAVETDTPQAGDIAVWKYPNGGGHTGIVLEVYGDGTALTLEGNTSAKSTSRQGDRVAKNRKKMKIGSLDSWGSVLQGYYRRVFTPEEQSKLYFDEAEQTLKFKA
jgi:hypothetical protein